MGYFIISLYHLELLRSSYQLVPAMHIKVRLASRGAIPSVLPSRASKIRLGSPYILPKFTIMS